MWFRVKICLVMKISDYMVSKYLQPAVVYESFLYPLTDRPLFITIIYNRVFLKINTIINKWK